MLYWTALSSGTLLVAASFLVRPRRAGAGWSLDVGFGERATRLGRILFLTGVALALLALLALR
jgi:hypothetical protein